MSVTQAIFVYNRVMNKYDYEATLPVNYKSAFKDADIRGLYGTEIDEVLAYRVAQAFVVEFSLTTVLVGRDMRVSSPSIHDAFVAGVLDTGADVVDIGLVTTPMMYFVSGNLSLHGVMITASHNPADYNGLKLVMPGAIPLTNKSGLKAIEHHVAKNILIKNKKTGRVKKQNIYRDYDRYVRGKASLKLKNNLNVVVDAGNGMGTLLTSILKKYSKLTTKELFFKLDGTFPNRESNPTLHKNQKQISSIIKNGNFDFGVAFDGDADRVAFFDEKGRYINAAIIGSLLVRYFLILHPKATCIYTVLASNVYQEVIKASGGKALKARVGHAFIKEQMRASDAQFGCEHSGHFYYKNTFYADSGIVTLLLVAKLFDEAKTQGLTFSQLLKPLMIYYQTEEILVSVKNKKETLLAVKKDAEEKSAPDITTFDGLTVDMGEFWYNVKDSVTEDALKFVVESTNKKIAVTERDNLLKFLNAHSGCGTNKI